MEEQWKQVPGYEGIYEASNTGKIRTCEGKITHSVKHGARLWQSRELKGRGNNPRTGKRVNLWKDKKNKDYLFCRVIAAAWLGLDMEQKYVAGKSPTVNHKDGNRLNNALDNLEVVSLKENIHHALDTGLQTSLKRIVLVCTNTLQEIQCKSYSETGRTIGRSGAYVSDCIIKKKTYVYGRDGEQFKIVYDAPTTTQDNSFCKVGKPRRCTMITVENPNGVRLTFNTLAECSVFLQRNKRYVSCEQNRKRTKLTHANGDIYKIVN